MAYNREKQRYECDRCGAKISKTKTVQLCHKCEKWLNESMKKEKILYSNYVR